MEITKSALLRLMSEVSIETEEKICEIYDATHGKECKINQHAKFLVSKFSPNKADILMPSDLYWYGKMDAMIDRIVKNDERYDLLSWTSKIKKSNDKTN